MRLSAFAPLGLLRLSGEPAPAERIYRSLNAGLGGEISTEEGARYEAKNFAAALGIARLQRDLQSAALQGMPSRSTGLLPIHELVRGLTPGRSDSMTDRRAELATRVAFPQGSTQVVMEEGLGAILGDAFIAYRTTPVDEMVVLSQADGGDVVYKRPDADRKVVRILEPMDMPGSGDEWHAYEVVSAPSDPITAAPAGLQVGETLALEPASLDRAEVVTVVDVVAEGASPARFLCSYDHPHDAGTVAFTHPLPLESTSKRHILVVVTQTAALDPELKRRVNDFMRRSVRSTATWSIAAVDAGGTTTQPFTIDVPSIGIANATPQTL